MKITSAEIRALGAGGKGHNANLIPAIKTTLYAAAVIFFLWVLIYGNWNFGILER
jgi:hypothetical protein